MLHDESYNISHNGDGTKTIHIQSYISHDRFSSGWQGFDFTLSTIPRTSSVSISNNNVDAGSNINVTINSASSSFRHVYHLVFGDGVYSFGSDIPGGTYQVTIPMECLTKIPGNNSGTGTIYCDTYNAGTKIGTSGVGITINVPSSTQPNFGYIGAEIINPQWNKCVQWHSKCKLSINEINASYGSWITSYRITGSNLDGYEQQCTTGTITNYGTLTYTATITDARGRTCTKTTTIDVHQYFNPNFNWSKAFRCNSSGTSDATSGTSVNVSASWGHASVGGSNGSICYVSSREFPSGGWGSETQISIEASKVLGGSYSLTKEYEIRFRVNDGLGANTYSYIKISTSSCVVGYKAGGQGLSIGKQPTKDGFEVDWATYFNKGFTVIGETVHNGKSSFADFVSAPYFHATSNGIAENFKVGDDAWIGDCNIDNSIMVKGNQNGASGWITFGNGGGKIGYNGANGSSIDIIPTSNNGAVNQVYLGSKILCGGAITPNIVGNNNGMDIGSASNRWNTIYVTNGTINTSDARDKENINYISYNKEHQDMYDINTRTQDQDNECKKHYNFVKDLNFATWDWIDGNVDGLDNVGFIAQDMVDDEIGDRILLYDKESDKYGYSVSNYVTTIAIALQHATNKIDKLEYENNLLTNRLGALEKMLGVEQYVY